MHDLLHDLMPPKERRVRTGFGRGVLAVPLRWGVMAVVLIASCSTSVSGTNAVSAPICIVGNTQCSGVVYQECALDGSRWVTRAQCTPGVTRCERGLGCVPDCIPGQTRCLDRDRYQVCFDNGRGPAWGEPRMCNLSAREQCSTDTNRCSQVIDACSREGSLSCDMSGNVYRCVNRGGVRVLEMVLNCRSQGFPGCLSLESGASLDACVNACGGRGMRLNANPGDRVPGSVCAQYECTDSRLTVRPNRCDCRPAGDDCTQDCQCASGRCLADRRCGTPSSCREDLGECPPRCGDGRCNGEETCAVCASDCGHCPADGGCPAGRTSCAGACRDLANDHYHCGACSRSCPFRGECIGGRCVLPTFACGELSVRCGTLSCPAHSVCETSGRAACVCENGYVGVYCSGLRCNGQCDRALGPWACVRPYCGSDGNFTVRCGGYWCPTNSVCIAGSCMCGGGFRSLFCDGTTCTGEECRYPNHWCST